MTYIVSGGALNSTHSHPDTFMEDSVVALFVLLSTVIVTLAHKYKMAVSYLFVLCIIYLFIIY